MTKTIGVIGAGKTTRIIHKEPAGVSVKDTIEVAAPLPVFKDLDIGERFIFKGHTFKKTSAFAGYRSGYGLYSFGSLTQISKTK